MRTSKDPEQAVKDAEAARVELEEAEKAELESRGHLATARNALGPHQRPSSVLPRLSLCDYVIIFRRSGIQVTHTNFVSPVIGKNSQKRTPPPTQKPPKMPDGRTVRAPEVPRRQSVGGERYKSTKTPRRRPSGTLRRPRVESTTSNSLAPRRVRTRRTRRKTCICIAYERFFFV